MRGIWIAAGVAGALVAAVAVIYGGTYAAYFLKAMTSRRGSPPPSPVTMQCELLERLPNGKVRVRFGFENQTPVDSTAMTLYLQGVKFDPPISALGDASLVEIRARVPAKSTVSVERVLDQPSTISVGRRITALACDPYHVAFADGSEWQLPSTGAGDDFP